MPSSPASTHECVNGDLRLVGGKDELEGRVELCLDGVWGTICDNFWSDLDAAVTCRQLTHGPTGETVTTLVSHCVIAIICM